jgi:4-diphosphocytidyl-2-C-methyl-D-erythritol kinase
MLSNPTELTDCTAPAKLNLFLHVTGRRPDGYHTLQTVFQLIDWADTLHFSRRGDGRIVHTNPLDGVAPEDDLTVRAARLLQQTSGCRYGVDIGIFKRLPRGGGLGGGSSDAATTLLALNRLWQLELPRATLMSLGLKLGADVPFFIFGQNAFAEGVGEALQPVVLPPSVYLVIHPGVEVPTAAIFSDEGLTRDTPPLIIADFLACHFPHEFGKNDLQAVAARKYAEVAQALAWLGSRSSHARMSGSGACVFARYTDEAAAQAVLAQLPPQWTGKVTRSLDCHPLATDA